MYDDTLTDEQELRVAASMVLLAVGEALVTEFQIRGQSRERAYQRMVARYVGRKRYAACKALFNMLWPEEE